MPEGALKASWPHFAFGEMAETITERVEPTPDDGEAYVGLEHLDSSSLTVRTWGSDVSRIGTKLRMRTGDILFAKRNAYLRRVALAPHDGLFSAHGMVLRARPNVVLPEFLPFFMQSDLFMERAKQISVGSLSPTINWKTLAEEEFALPPLEEQRRLAVALTAAESLIETLWNLKESLCRVEVGLFENVIRDVPDNELVPVIELLREPPRNGLSPPPNSEGSGLGTVSISAVSHGLFEPRGCIKHANIEVEKARPFFVQREDAFVIRGNGNRQLCGKVGLSKRSYDELFYPDLLIRLRFNTEKIFSEFAVAQWNLPSVHRRLSARAKSSNGIWKVNGQDIRAHTLFAPPIPKQQAVMESLRELREALQDARQREQVALDLKTTLLRQMDQRA